MNFFFRLPKTDTLIMMEEREAASKKKMQSLQSSEKSPKLKFLVFLILASAFGLLCFVFGDGSGYERGLKQGRVLGANDASWNLSKGLNDAFSEVYNWSIQDGNPTGRVMLLPSGTDNTLVAAGTGLELSVTNGDQSKFYHAQIHQDGRVEFDPEESMGISERDPNVIRKLQVNEIYKNHLKLPQFTDQVSRPHVPVVYAYVPIMPTIPDCIKQAGSPGCRSDRH